MQTPDGGPQPVSPRRRWRGTVSPWPRQAKMRGDLAAGRLAEALPTELAGRLEQGRAQRLAGDVLSWGLPTRMAVTSRRADGAWIRGRDVQAARVGGSGGALTRERGDGLVPLLAEIAADVRR